MNIGERIRARRKELKLTQVQVAKAAGIEQGTLSDIERGRTDAPAGDTLAGLCKALQTTARWIIYGIGDHAVQPLDEEQESLLSLLRLMSPDQRATLLRLGRALLEDPPDERREESRPFRLS